MTTLSNEVLLLRLRWVVDPEDLAAPPTAATHRQHPTTPYSYSV